MGVDISFFLCLCARRTGPRIQAEGSDEEAAACPCLGNVVVYGERGRCLYGVAVCLRACVVLHLRFFSVSEAIDELADLTEQDND